MSAQVKVDTTDSVITQSGDVQPQVEVVGQQGIKREASCEEDERVAKVSKQEHSVPVVESVTKPEAVVDSEVNPAAVPVAKVESKADADMRMKFAAMVAVYGIPVASKCAGCEGLNGMSAPCVQIAPGTACLRCAVHNKNCSLGLPPNVSFGEYVHAGHDHHAGQDRAGHAQAGQNHAGQNHAGQNHAGQNHAGQKHAEHITSRIPIDTVLAVREHLRRVKAFRAQSRRLVENMVRKHQMLEGVFDRCIAGIDHDMRRDNAGMQLRGL